LGKPYPEVRMVEVVGAGVRTGSWREYDEPQLSAIQRGALEAFREQGYHGTSVRDIARRVGVTVPALYYHFENKQAIFVSLLETSMADFLWRVRAADEEASEDVRDRFCNVIESVVLGMTHRSSHILDAEMRYLEPSNRRHYAAMRKEVEDLLLEIIREGKTRGVFELSRPEDTARALLGMCQAVATWYTPTGPLSPQDVAARYVDIALRAVGASRQR